MTDVAEAAPATKVAPAFGVVVAALVVVYVVWGSTYLAIRVVVQEAPPLSAMGVRYIAAAVVLGAILAARGGLHRLALTRRQVLGTAFLGLMLPVLGNGMVSVAENIGAPSGVTALLIAFTPLMIVLFRTVDGDRPSARSLLGVLLGLAGLAYLVLAGRGGTGNGLSVRASLLILFAATCWGLGSYVQPRLWLPRDVFVTAVYEMLFGGVMLLVAARASGEHLATHYSLRTWGALAYLVVFGSVIAFTAYVWLLESAPISLVATYAYVNPVVAVFLGWLILSESVTVPIVVGGAIVVLAVATVISAERPPSTPRIATAAAGEPDPLGGPPADPR